MSRKISTLKHLLFFSLGIHCTNTLCSDEQQFWATEIFPHPDYNPYASHTHDIAMLKLPNPAQLTDNVNLACLPEKKKKKKTRNNGGYDRWQDVLGNRCE